MQLSLVVFLYDGAATGVVAFGVVGNKDKGALGNVWGITGEVHHIGEAAKGGIGGLYMMVEAIGQRYFLPLAIGLLQAAAGKGAREGTGHPCAIRPLLGERRSKKKKIMRVKHSEQRTENREQRTVGREQRAVNREQRTENREQ